MTNAGVFVKYTVKAFDVETTVYTDGEMEIAKVLDNFNQQCFNSNEKSMEYGGEKFLRYAYEYGVYNLYVYYYKGYVLFFIVDGNVGGYAVVNKRVWNQNFL